MFFLQKKTTLFSSYHRMVLLCNKLLHAVIVHNIQHASLQYPNQQKQHKLQKTLHLKKRGLVSVKGNQPTLYNIVVRLHEILRRDALVAHHTANSLSKHIGYAELNDLRTALSVGNRVGKDDFL